MRPPLQGKASAKASTKSAGSPGAGGADAGGGIAAPSSPFEALSGGPQVLPRGSGGALGARHMSQSQARFSSSKSSRRLNP